MTTLYDPPYTRYVKPAIHASNRGRWTEQHKAVLSRLLKTPVGDVKVFLWRQYKETSVYRTVSTTLMQAARQEAMTPLISQWLQALRRYETDMEHLRTAYLREEAKDHKAGKLDSRTYVSRELAVELAVTDYRLKGFPFLYDTEIGLYVHTMVDVQASIEKFAKPRTPKVPRVTGRRSRVLFSDDYMRTGFMQCAAGGPASREEMFAKIQGREQRRRKVFSGLVEAGALVPYKKGKRKLFGLPGAILPPDVAPASEAPPFTGAGAPHPFNGSTGTAKKWVSMWRAGLLTDQEFERLTTRLTEKEAA